MPIKILIIDDSALVRTILTEIIQAQPDMEVVGTAPDPLIAREKIKALNPDVLTLDVEMPKMDGLVFLEKLMRLRPMPVIMVSSLTERSSSVTLHALEMGAFDFITKPKVDIRNSLNEYADELVNKIRAAARRGCRTMKTGQNVLRAVEARKEANPAGSVARHFYTTEKIVAVGASTGGTEALKELLTALPPDCPGVLVTQHMPPTFTGTFARRLDTLCEISVKEAEQGERVLPGHAYIAPGDRHLLLGKSGANYVIELSAAAPCNRHRPSVDVLFRSVAKNAGGNAAGVIMTGMGSDGADGLLEIRQAGGRTFAQDEESCVVFGMPKEAINRGGVDEVVPLHDIARRLMLWLSAQGKRAFRI